MDTVIGPDGREYLVWREGGLWQGKPGIRDGWNYTHTSRAGLLEMMGIGPVNKQGKLEWYQRSYA